MLEVLKVSGKNRLIYKIKKFSLIEDGEKIYEHNCTFHISSNDSYFC